MHKILLVDDERNILAGYNRNLRSKFQLFIAESGKDGLKIMHEKGPFAVVVSDYKMPEMNGIDFLSKVRELYPDTVRIMLTGYADLNAATNAVNEGNIFRFLSKPCPVEQMSKNLYDAVGQHQLVTAEKELLNNTLKGSIKMLIEILSSVNPEAFSQATQSRNLTKSILARLGKQITWDIEIAVLLSKIGLVTIPTEILQKKNKGIELTAEEKKMYYKHAEFGATLLKNIPRLEKIAEAISFQYSSYDGETGARDFKVGENIPFVGRLLKVLNDFNALIKLGSSEDEALEKMQRTSEKYDPDIFGALLAEVSGLSSGQIVSMKNLIELKDGMLLAEGVRDINGFLLIPKGSELSSISLMKIINYNKMTKIAEPIKVIEHTQ